MACHLPHETCHDMSLAFTCSRYILKNSGIGWYGNVWETPPSFFFEEGVSWMLEYFVSSSHSTVIYKSCFELFSILFHIFRHFRPMIFPTYLPSVAPEKWLRMPSNVRLIAQGKFPPEAETPGILPRISLHSSWFLASMIGKCCVAAGWNMLKIPSTKNCQQEM